MEERRFPIGGMLSRGERKSKEQVSSTALWKPNLSCRLGGIQSCGERGSGDVTHFQRVTYACALLLKARFTERTFDLCKIKDACTNRKGLKWILYKNY